MNSAKPQNIVYNKTKRTEQQNQPISVIKGNIVVKDIKPSDIYYGSNHISNNNAASEPSSNKDANDANIADTPSDHRSGNVKLEQNFGGRKRLYKLETDGFKRARLRKRLLTKLRGIIEELAVRSGQQAVVLVANEAGSKCTVLGTEPLKGVVRAIGPTIMEKLNSHWPPSPEPPRNPNLFELPPLLVNGIPRPVELMTQAQLRAFIPLMLKYSTGRGKPYWGNESKRPPWWPQSLPWANVRLDIRSNEAKRKHPWTLVLRECIINCYKFHEREDLLSVNSSENDNGNSIDTTQENIKQDGYYNDLYTDSNNATITLPDGTIAHIEGFISLDADQANSILEACINEEGHIVLITKDKGIGQVKMEPQSNEESFSHCNRGDQVYTKRNNMTAARQTSSEQNGYQLLQVLSLNDDNIVSNAITGNNSIPQIEMETITFEA